MVTALSRPNPGFLDVCDDVPDISEQNGETPSAGLLKVHSALISGKDVWVLSLGDSDSGFVPAALTRMLIPDIHVEKLIYPMQQSMGYKFSGFALGYLFGLADSERYRDEMR